jgi:hypothetical protein
MKKLNTLFLAILFSSYAFAQIPNASFETWMNMGSYTMPDQWDNLNTMTSSMSTYTCMQGTPGNPGSSYLKLVSKNVMGMGVMPGVAVCGMLDMSSMTNIKPKSGFAFSQRPAQFTGSWQYMAAGSDQGFASVILTKWNSATHLHDTVATAYQTLSGMAMSWTSFSLNFTYMKSFNPDSAIIFLSSSKVASPVANSYLYVDNLAFAGFVTTVNNVTAQVSGIALSPNPANGNTTLSYNGISTGAISISISDLNGRIVRKMNSSIVTGNNAIKLNVADISKGFYMVNIANGVTVQTVKLVIE